MNTAIVRTAICATSLLVSSISVIAQQRDPTVPLANGPERPAPSSACGMPVQPVTEAADPRIIKSRPHDRFTMRIAEPGVCNGNVPVRVARSTKPLPTFLGPKR